jgi:hypothetical protein
VTSPSGKIGTARPSDVILDVIFFILLLLDRLLIRLSTFECAGQLSQSGVGVEKVHFPQNKQNLGDRKCLGKLRKSFAGHPDAILFFANFAGKSFSTATGVYPH